MTWADGDTKEFYIVEVESCQQPTGGADLPEKVMKEWQQLKNSVVKRCRECIFLFTDFVGMEKEILILTTYIRRCIIINEIRCEKRRYNKIARFLRGICEVRKG